MVSGHFYNSPVMGNPQLWKSSVVIPVPKKSKPTVLNDYRTVVLTAIIMKCFERIVMELVVSQTKPFNDPFQFAYRAGRSVGDAILIFFTQHLQPS